MVSSPPAAGAFTVIFALALTLATLFVAVIVYVVVTAGLTGSESAGLTLPIPLSSVTVVELVDVQLSVAVPPASIVLGVAVIATVGAPGTAEPTVTVTLAGLLPAPFVAVMVYVGVAFVVPESASTGLT